MDRHSQIVINRMSCGEKRFFLLLLDVCSEIVSVCKLLEIWGKVKADSMGDSSIVWDSLSCGYDENEPRDTYEWIYHGALDYMMGRYQIGFRFKKT